MTTKLHLAQVNIARCRYPLDDPRMAGFVNALAPVNALADRSPGFVWRLQSEAGDSTAYHVFGQTDLIVNLSVWTDVESLRDFVYRSHHLDVFREKKQWFVPLEDQPSLVLWWIPEHHRPTVPEAEAKLVLLRARGPTREAFSLKHVLR